MKIRNFAIRIVAIVALLAMVIAPREAFAKNRNAKKPTVKILAIGNSFSQDAIEQNLWELAHADSINVVIGNLYYGGCSLEQHWQFLTDSLSKYDYRKVVDGVKTNTPKYNLPTALADEDWDYISFQQASNLSGMPLTYAPFLDELMKYVRTKTKAKAKIIFHSTWAYANNSTHPGFVNYGCSQEAMFSDIIQTTEDVMNSYPFDVLVPAGTAIQNARTAMGDVLNRDGYHLNLTYGRYTAACTWFEAIFGKSVIGNTYMPDGVTEEQRAIAQKAAHAAVAEPYKVSDLR